MGTHLHQALRALCFRTQWKYAIFWKLKRRTRMMLTWEDAYYDNQEQHDLLEKMSFNDIGGNLNWHSRDPLGLAVAKMSYHVYPLGEGVIGQVAVTGKHMWIFVTDSCLPFESDGWQTQFSAGIKTIVVVPVGPYGVVQLGSFNKIPEDLKLVNHIRDAFFAVQGSSLGCIPSIVKNSSSLSDISTRNSGSGNFHDHVNNLGRHLNKDKTIMCSPKVSSPEEPANHSCVVLPPGDMPRKQVEAINNDGELGLSTLANDTSVNLLQSRSECLLQKQAQTRLLIDHMAEGESSCFRSMGVGSEDHETQSPHNSFNKNYLYNVTPPTYEYGVNLFCLQPDLLDSTTGSDQNGLLSVPEPLDMQVQNVLENNVDHQREITNTEPLNAPFKFSAGCELYEVLGPAFCKQISYSDWEPEKTVMETAIEMSGGVDSSSLLTADSGTEHLLEAVVANVCRSETDLKCEKSLCNSAKSLLTTEKMPEPLCEKLTVGSSGYSFDQSLVEKDTHCLSSEGNGLSSSKGFSSRSHSTFSEQLGSLQEPTKINKKRARPGENCRPRPRDRQLIQDRIKELRELVPNGSKCSIDSLLERTIKHMLFMQGITKHADKLNKCIKSKLCDEEKVVRGLPNYDQGSSWAMEVGSHLKVCQIMIENINMNGQMLIEMMCEECNHFLQIAEAIRSLGLTILKGVTEACGEKTWMHFVVEGQNNRVMHRMDILWSLVQILQSKTAI
ncbi:transcription factor EMB1444-like isoform X2 [Diospyros lotus]|uniref:transcription factor EMB1444-like isoform X2 n=1 Tax=Diospyros lotus TaxID=55363 RepID=UPI00224C7FFB|nr:transcription factor EMB1444-like isoform X2 [Diospyros lotus]